jgi:hypothetical protein
MALAPIRCPLRKGEGVPKRGKAKAGGQKRKCNGKDQPPRGLSRKMRL